MGSISRKAGISQSGVKIKQIAMPASGYTFDHWGGIDSALILNDTLTMPAHNAAVKAVFQGGRVTYYTFIATTTTTRWGRSHASGNYAVGALINAHQDGRQRICVDHWAGGQRIGT